MEYFNSYLKLEANIPCHGFRNIKYSIFYPPSPSQNIDALPTPTFMAFLEFHSCYNNKNMLHTSLHCKSWHYSLQLHPPMQHNRSKENTTNQVLKTLSYLQIYSPKANEILSQVVINFIFS